MDYLKIKKEDIRCSLLEQIWLFKIAFESKPNFEEFEELEDPVGSIYEIDEIIKDVEKGLDEDSKTKFRRLVNPKRDFLSDLMDHHYNVYYGL